MSRNSHDIQAGTNSMTSQASEFYTRTPLAHNNVPLIHTHYLICVRFKLTYGTSDPQSPSNVQALIASVTPTGNYTPCNNPPKPVLHVPFDPDSDPSFLDSSLSDSLDS